MLIYHHLNLPFLSSDLIALPAGVFILINCMFTINSANLLLCFHLHIHILFCVLTHILMATASAQC